MENIIKYVSKNVCMHERRFAKRFYQYPIYTEEYKERQTINDGYEQFWVEPPTRKSLKGPIDDDDNKEVDSECMDYIHLAQYSSGL
jgi:hypothetical protein